MANDYGWLHVWVEESGRGYAGAARRRGRRIRPPKRKTVRACAYCGAVYTQRGFTADQAYTELVGRGLTPDRIAAIRRGAGRRTAADDQMFDFAASIIASVVQLGFHQKTVAGVASLSPSMTTRMLGSVGFQRLPRSVYNKAQHRDEKTWFSEHLAAAHNESALERYLRRRRDGFILWPADVAVLYGPDAAQEYVLRHKLPVRHSPGEPGGNSPNVGSGSVWLQRCPAHTPILN